tara:strand:+ start:11235 stop:11993 length:759 start_codon:yes stop_codon:yes gene_type:complete
MSEAQPSKKVGGHAYGRRNLNLSNTAEEGALCIYSGHSIGRFSSSSMRYDSHQACVRCVAAAREGRISFDIDRLLKRERKRALKFWSKVDIGQPDECWEWQGYKAPGTGMPQFPWRRPGISKSTQHHPQRVAMWYTWGDLGYTGVKSTCGNKYCCNPFHLIPQKIGVFVDHDSYLESFELQCQLHTLRQKVAEYTLEEAMKQQEKEINKMENDARADLIFAPDTEFADRFETVMEDMLFGRHSSQYDNHDNN